MMPQIEKDKDSTLNYWLDMRAILGDRRITTVDVDPAGTLSGLTVSTVGANPTQQTGINGTIYRPGSLIGLQVSGGAVGERYQVVSRMTLDSGETDDRTLIIDIVEK